MQPPAKAIAKANGGQYTSRPAAQEIMPPRAPDIIQKGSRVTIQAPMMPPAKAMRMLNVIADSVIGVPYIVLKVVVDHDHASPGTMTHAIRKPQKPTIMVIRPTMVIGMLWPGRSLAEPSRLYLPIRGPRLMRTPNAKKPATMCTTPDAPKS